MHCHFTQGVSQLRCSPFPAGLQYGWNEIKIRVHRIVLELCPGRGVQTPGLLRAGVRGGAGSTVRRRCRWMTSLLLSISYCVFPEFSTSRSECIYLVVVCTCKPECAPGVLPSQRPHPAVCGGPSTCGGTHFAPWTVEVTWWCLNFCSHLLQHCRVYGTSSPRPPPAQNVLINVVFFFFLITKQLLWHLFLVS